MRFKNSALLYNAATRILRHCAQGQTPDSSDVRLLSSHALPSQAGLSAAELAGTTLWILRRNREMMHLAA